MNNFIKQVIEEKFVSKKQQKYFYAKASDKSLPKKERKKWSKWSKEFSDKTDFEKLPEKAKEKEMGEIVDDKGNISMDKKPKNFNTKGITSNMTSDEVVRTGAGSMGIHGVHGTHTSLRYWAESDMSKALGYDETLGDDENYKRAYNHFRKELGLSDEETKERLKSMGYDEHLPGDKVRLIENPKKFIEEYIDEILLKKNDQNEFVSKNEEETKINSIIQKQIKSLKNSAKNNNISIDDIIKHLKKDE
jgi:hypothetical protein